MAAASSSSSSSATIDGFEYDVFLSFRGEDTRSDFTGFLWKALDYKGIRTFFVEEDIHKGDEITPLLLRSIEQSKMALVVLSKNYASSAFCLNELSHIIECTKENGRWVLPIFYDVEPSDVRYLKNTYEEAMAKHESNSRYSTNMLEKWKIALHQVANLSGIHFKKGEKYLYKFIEEIVEEVSTKIKPLTLHVADNQVGLGAQMKDVISLLNLGSNDEIRMVGIHGYGGIGKTTLAVAVYNSIASQFQGSCYLENVRENFVKNGLTYLQKIILSKTIGEKKIELTSSREGITEIKKRLGQKKILLLLDDVDKAEQLEAMAGSPSWFGRGSRVIITTRDKGLLKCHGVESIYEVKLLNKEDAFELLRQKALRTNEVTPSYNDVLNRALTYASGLPLALEVIGSHLFKKTVEECKYVLDHYERIPDPKIQTILKVSFDALDKEEQHVFLDIACVFKGQELKDVKNILHAHYGDSKKHHIDVLVEKSLIKISKSSQVTLHDLIADMGEEIERQESPDEPGRRSRLWLAEDIVQVLEENQGIKSPKLVELTQASQTSSQVLQTSPIVPNVTQGSQRDNLDLQVSLRGPRDLLPIPLMHIFSTDYENKLWRLVGLISCVIGLAYSICSTGEFIAWRFFIYGVLIMGYLIAILFAEQSSRFVRHVWNKIKEGFASLMQTLQSSSQVTGPVVPDVAQGSQRDTTLALSVSPRDPRDPLCIWLKHIFSMDYKNNTWRIVGLMSSVVGLSCFALSPSFIRLIRGWNAWKFILYEVFSLVVLIAFLSAEQSTRPVDHVWYKIKGFAILMFIAVYAFYYDKAVDGKPEILSLVSNAAFALMSLCYSNITKYAHEMGVFSFFLSCLTVQLWIINWMLIFVAICFSFPLFYLHCSSDHRDPRDSPNIPT